MRSPCQAFTTVIVALLAVAPGIAACRHVDTQLAGDDLTSDKNSDLYTFIHADPPVSTRGIYTDASSSQLITLEYGNLDPVIAALTSLRDKFNKPVVDLWAQRSTMLSDDSTLQAVDVIYKTLKLSQDIAVLLPDLGINAQRATIKAVTQKIVGATASPNDIAALNIAFDRYLLVWQPTDYNNQQVMAIRNESARIVHSLFSFAPLSTYQPTPVDAVLITEALNLVDLGAVYQRQGVAREEYTKFLTLKHALRIKQLLYALRHQPDAANLEVVLASLVDAAKGLDFCLETLQFKNYRPGVLTLRAVTLDPAKGGVGFEEFVLTLYADNPDGAKEVDRQAYLQGTLPKFVGGAAATPTVAWELPIQRKKGSAKGIVATFVWWLKTGGRQPSGKLSSADVNKTLQAFYDYVDRLSDRSTIYKAILDYIVTTNKLIGKGELDVSPARFTVPSPAEAPTPPPPAADTTLGSDAVSRNAGVEGLGDSPDADSPGSSSGDGEQSRTGTDAVDKHGR